MAMLTFSSPLVAMSLDSIFLLRSYKYFQYMFISEVVSHGVLCPFFFALSNTFVLVHVLSQMCCIILFGIMSLYPTYCFLITTTASSPTPYIIRSFAPAHALLNVLRAMRFLFHSASFTACTTAVALDAVGY